MVAPSHLVLRLHYNPETEEVGISTNCEQERQYIIIVAWIFQILSAFASRIPDDLEVGKNTIGDWAALVRGFWARCNTEPLEGDSVRRLGDTDPSHVIFTAHDDGFSFVATTGAKDKPFVVCPSSKATHSPGETDHGH